MDQRLDRDRATPATASRRRWLRLAGAFAFVAAAALLASRGPAAGAAPDARTAWSAGVTTSLHRGGRREVG